MNLRGIDLNLLVILEALIAEKSVSRAAQRINMTQSAVSHALKRLRQTFNDELLIRTSRGMEPTSRANIIAKALHGALQQIEHAVDQQRVFVPSESDRTFTIRISEYVAVYLLPSLCKQLRREAPGVKLRVEHFINRSENDVLTTDEIHVRLAFAEQFPVDYNSTRLLEDDFVVLMSRNHPAAMEKMTLERYIALAHLKISASAIGSNLVDDMLAKRGLTRHIMLVVPSWLEMRQIIESTDLVAVIPRHWSTTEEFSRDCVCAPLPLDEVKLAVDQLWHVRNNDDPGHIWLRKLITENFSIGAKRAPSTGTH